MTFWFDRDDDPTFGWSEFDPLGMEGKDVMAAYLSGLMHALYGGAELLENYARADQQMTFTIVAPDGEPQD